MFVAVDFRGVMEMGNKKYRLQAGDKYYPAREKTLNSDQTRSDKHRSLLLRHSAGIEPDFPKQGYLIVYLHNILT